MLLNVKIFEGERRTKLKSICKTRWVEQHEAFEIFIDLFEPLVYCCEDIKDSGGERNRETRVDAQSLFLALSTFPFIISLVITKDVLAYTKALSIKLQGCYVDVSAYNHVSLVLTTLKSARKNIDSVHACLYDRAMQIASTVNVQESLQEQLTGNSTAITHQHYQLLGIISESLPFLR